MASDYVDGKLPPEIRSKINKRNSQKGGAYERDVAKKIAAYHGIDWKQAFLRTKRTTGGQPHGDLMPIHEMYTIWKDAGLGPIECKHQKVWSFDEIFKRPNTCTVFQYWLKSNDDTNSDNSIVFFTKAGVLDYVLIRDDSGMSDIPAILFNATDPQTKINYMFKIITLERFLKTTWVRE